MPRLPGTRLPGKIDDRRLDTSLLFAAIIVLVVMGLVLFLAVSVLERALIPWHVSQRNVVTR